MAQKKKLDFQNPLLANIEPTAKDPRRNPDLIRNEEGGNSKQEGLPPELTRFSAIVSVKNVNDLRDYAYTHRRSIKSVLDMILTDFFEAYRADPNNEPLLDHTRGEG